jgi:excisionase family DNA binding protein
VSEDQKTRGEGLLSVSEVADRIGVSEPWVRDAVNFDGMPCIRYNARMWRFHWPTVLAWLQKRR